jgi:seryl-tRNA synthetase
VVNPNIKNIEDINEEFKNNSVFNFMNNDVAKVIAKLIYKTRNQYFKIKDYNDKINKLNKKIENDLEIVDPKEVNSEIVDEIKDYQDSINEIRANSYHDPSKIMLEVMSKLLEALDDENIDTAFNTKAQQYLAFQDFHSNREMIILFEELLKYNNYKIRDIIQSVNEKLDFTMEISGVRITANEVKIKEDLNIFYQKFLADIKVFLNGIP